jgi:hypothetical protein
MIKSLDYKILKFLIAFVVKFRLPRAIMDYFIYLIIFNK